MRQGSFRGALVAGLSLAALVVFTSTAFPAAVGRPGARHLSLGVDTTERDASVSSGIAIRRSAAAARRHPTVAYSVRLRHLSSRRERMRIVGSIHASYCVGPDIDGTADTGSPCERLAGDDAPNPHYELRLEARLYRAARPGDPSDRSTRLLNPPRSVGCTVDEHHCPITVTVNRTLSSPRGGKPYLNLEVFAWTRSQRWHPSDRLELEGDCLHDDYRRCASLPANRPRRGDPALLRPTEGLLGVLRIGSDYGTPPDPGAAQGSSTTIDEPSLEVNGRPTVVHSARLDHVVVGDVVEAAGRVEIAGHGFDHYAGSWWVLSPSPGTAAPISGAPDRFASPNSGTNCLGPHSHLGTAGDGSCSIAQRAVVTVPAGAATTMYLNYVVVTRDEAAPPNPSATVTGGEFDLRCDSEPRSGPGCAVSP
jgi:hypothetical protein